MHLRILHSKECLKHSHSWEFFRCSILDARSKRRVSRAASIVAAVFIFLLAGSIFSAAAAPRMRRAPVTISYASDLLSDFFGRPTYLRAAVYIPTQCQRARSRCAVMYHIPGYGGSVATAWNNLSDYAAIAHKYPKLAMAHVLLDPSFLGGFQYFVDSENYGPWNSAAIQELIPYLEKRFRFGGSSVHRFILGASSGGWAATWLQVSNPAFFNGLWAISPDPVDFRHFYQVNVTPGSRDNFYYRSHSSLRPLDRRNSITIKRVMQSEDNNPRQGGFISSYEFAWSPKGRNGLPLRLFNRSTGALNGATEIAWKSRDVHVVLQRGGDELRRMLDGKLNFYCGSADDFFYDLPTAAMCSYLKTARYRAVCHIIPGRTHGNVVAPSSLYPQGLHMLIVQQAIARSGG